METIKSELWRLNSNDLVKSLKVVIFTAFMAALYSGFKAHGLDLSIYDWHGIVESAITAGVGYLFNKFVSDDQGKVLGKI